MTDNDKYGKMLAIVEFFHSRDFGNEDFTRANYNARMRFTTYAGKSILKMHSNLIDRYAKSNKSPDDFLCEFGKIAVDLKSGDLSDKKVELDATYIKVFYDTLRELADEYDIELFSKEYYKK